VPEKSVSLIITMYQVLNGALENALASSGSGQNDLAPVLGMRAQQH